MEAVPPRGIHHVQLAMPPGRQDEAEAFYAGVLGLERVAKPAELAGRGGCWFRASGVELHLGVDDDFRPAKKAHPALVVDDLVQMRQRLQGSGVQTQDDVPLNGRQRFHTFDPFGNRLEIIEDAGAGVPLPVKQLRDGAVLPAYAHPGDAAMDLSSMIDVQVGPGERAMVPTGVAIAIPEGYAGLVLPRSGLASKRGLTLANAPGLIDSGYRGEVTCAVVNLDRERAVSIHVGDRIAQLLIVSVPVIEPGWAEDLPPSDRGEGGFGSTGS
ncbi:MAG: dUTP diphosphatase [Actinomycetota bacterium]